MKRFDTVFPAAGSGNSAVEMTCDELFACSGAREWVDVCKPIQYTGEYANVKSNPVNEGRGF